LKLQRGLVLRFRAGPRFQAPAGLAEIEVRQGIGRVLSQAGLIGYARLLVLLLFEELVPDGKFLGTLINGCGGHGQMRNEPEHRDE
jgi:hypothetical protein